MDRDSQIKAIEKTFEDNKKSIERHYSKPNVVPVEILPVYPDFKVFTMQILMFVISLSFAYLRFQISVMEISMCSSYI